LPDRYDFSGTGGDELSKRHARHPIAPRRADALSGQALSFTLSRLCLISEKRKENLIMQHSADSHRLLNQRIAILVADDFEQVELPGPRDALEAAGATANIVSPAREKVQGMHHLEKGDRFDVDVPLDRAKAGDYDALLIRPSTAPSPLLTGPVAGSLIQRRVLPAARLQSAGLRSG
jgi:DJ-1/PfpI family